MSQRLAGIAARVVRSRAPVAGGVLTAMAVTAAVGASVASAAALVPTNLTVNYADHPLGIESTPHFSWDSGVVRQTAYEIKVTPLSGAGEPLAPVWDTGTVGTPGTPSTVGSDDLDIPYTGPALTSSTRYDWEVRSWDTSGNASAWSTPDWFETGLLNQPDWTADWISGRPVQDHNWADMTETVGFTMPTANAGAGFLFHAQPVGKTSWGESYRWQLSMASGANTSLSAAAPADATTVKVASVSNLAAGRVLTIGSGSDQEAVTIAGVGSAAAANTALAAPVAAGDTNIPVASVSGYTVGAPLTIDTGSAQESTTISSVGTAAGAATTLFASAASGATNVKVASTSGMTVRQQIGIGSGTDFEERSIANVGTAVVSTTLFAPASAGATNIKVASTSGLVAGAVLSIDSTGGSPETATIQTVGTQGRNTTASAASSAGATGIRLASTTGLTVGDVLTVDTGQGQETATIASIPSPAPASPNPNVQFTGALSKAHASGVAASDAGTGVTLIDGLAAGHASGAAATYAGTGVTLTDGLSQGHASGASARGLGTGITVSQALAHPHAPGAVVGSLGTGVTFTPQLDKAHASGVAVSEAAAPQLVEQVQHYNKAISHTSEQNGSGPAAVSATALATITPSQLAAAGFTGSNYTSPHQLTIRTSGATITTSIDGTVVATLTPAAGATQLDGYNDLQTSGTVGFASGSSITVSSLSVNGAAGNFATTFAKGANPLQSGDVTDAGLVLPGVVSADNVAHDSVLPIANPAPLLAKQFTEFSGHGDVASARLYVAGAGWPVVSIDGKAVTNARMYPDRVDYGKRIPYNTFDVTKLLESGKNSIGAQLGRGYYALVTPDTWMWQQAPYDIGVPAFLAQLKVTYADGTTQLVGTDTSWKTLDGPTTYDEVYTGEKYDARLLPAGWDTPAFDNRAWADAAPATGPRGFNTTSGLPTIPPFVATENPPVTVQQTLEPVSIKKFNVPVANTYVFDFGQIASGWPQLTIKGCRAGQTIMLDGDESLNADGTVRQGVGSDYVAGRYSTSYYTCSGNGVEQWTPSYSYTGARYVEVTGLPAAPTDESPEVTWQVARSDNPVTGSVTTSNALLNRILRNGQWSEWNNTVQTETDTPDREKNGWTGDAQIDSLSEMMTNNHDAFGTQFMNMLADTQTSGTPPYGVTNPGQISLIAPNPRGEYGTDNAPAESATTWYGPDPEWDAALFMYPWEMYEQYGDTQILSRLWTTQQGMMDYYTHYMTPTGTGGVPYAYSSGLSVYMAQGTTGTAGAIVDNLEYYWFFANYMSTVASKLNHPTEAASYRTLANAVEKSFIDHYWSTAGGPAQGGSFISGNIESEDGLALAFGLVQDAVSRGLLPSTAPQTVADAIAYDVQNVGGTHIYAGVEGIAPVFQALDQYGYSNLAYQLATQTSSPSYGNQIAQGATSMWESWGGGSLDHHYRASIGQWYYQHLAGIQPNLNGTTSTPSEPGYFAGPIDSVGYRAIQIMPFVPSVASTDSVPPTSHATKSTLDSVSGSMQTVRGAVTSAWTRRSDGRIKLTVSIPNNTDATVWVPQPGGTSAVTAPQGATFEGTRTVGANASAALGGGLTRYAVYTVGAGAWTFNADGLQTTASLSPAPVGGYYSNPTVTLTGSDNGGPGVQSTEYMVNNSGTWRQYTGSFKITGDGTVTLQYRSTDRDGKVEAANTLTFDNDATPPVTTATASPSLANGSVPKGPVTVTLAATEPGSAPASSGLAQTQYTLDSSAWIVAGGPITISGEGGHTLQYRSTDNAGNVEETKTLSVVIDPTATGTVGGTVPSTLGISLSSTPAALGTFVPGIAQTYTTTLGMTITSTAGDATLSASDANSGFPASFAGHLVNTSGGRQFPAAQGLQVNAVSAAPGASGGGVFTDLATTNPATLLTYSAPTSNDQVTVGFKQPIAATDPLRTGAYSKAITFTLSTTTP
jgi:alpha-L-rhamnosidase